MGKGSLTVVGTGIRLSQMTMEARISIESADKVLYAVADAVTETAIKKLNSTAESLQPFYKPGKYCLVTYKDMVNRILSFLRKGLDVCAAFYGHPGVFVYSSHEAIQQARREGFRAVMLPATSAEDNLFADLGVDPATSGCQSFETTDFLIRRRKFDPTSHLILWQIGNIGNWKPERQDCASNLQALVDVLEKHYDPDHEVVLYLAAQYASCDPMIERVPLSEIPQIPISNVTTLYVPPRGIAPIDYAMLDLLGIPRALVRKALQRNSRKRSSVKGRSRHTRNSQRTKVPQEQGRTQ
jgi:uncharacterized protein YabN with tetrapyrrole methylase and pyrophosphatase domain